MSIDYNAIEKLIDRLVESTLMSPVTPDVLEQACESLHKAGVSVLRVNLSWTTLHPTILALTLKWWRDRPFDDVIRYLHEESESAEWLNSPGYYALQEGISALDISLEQSPLAYSFPILEELRKDGGTHYLLRLISFSQESPFNFQNDGVIISFLSDKPGGFTQEECDVLTRFEKHIALALKMALRERIIVNTLSAYLGQNAALRVLSGSIKLGDGEIIPAAIWFSDLRNSTDLGDRLPGNELLSTLNEYFSCTAGAVKNNGGEVLRFVGDAVLAIFPSDKQGMEQACQQASQAAHEALVRLEDINKQRAALKKEPLKFGIGLHCGELMFGNIGIPERMDFSVTGPAANEAARIESMTKTLDVSVLASSDFCAYNAAQWKSVGRFPLRGVGRSLELFTLQNQIL